MLPRAAARQAVEQVVGVDSMGWSVQQPQVIVEVITNRVISDTAADSGDGDWVKE